MTTDPTYAELQASVELLKADIQRLTRVAEYQQTMKMQLHLDNQKRIALLQEEIAELRAELAIAKGAK